MKTIRLRLSFLLTAAAATAVADRLPAAPAPLLRYQFLTHERKPLTMPLTPSPNTLARLDGAAISASAELRISLATILLAAAAVVARRLFGSQRARTRQGRARDPR